MITITDLRAKGYEVIKGHLVDDIPGKAPLHDLIEADTKSLKDMRILQLWEKDYEARGIPFIVVKRFVPHPRKKWVLVLWKLRYGGGKNFDIYMKGGDI